MEEAADTASKQSFISGVTLHQSWVMLALSIIILQIGIAITSILIQSPEGYLFTFIGGIGLYFVNLFLDIVLTIVDSLCVLVLILQWYYDYYEISPGKILYNERALKRQEKELQCSSITHVTRSQNILGKLFGFGTIVLSASSTDEPFYLYNIPNLKSNLPVIQNALIRIHGGPDMVPSNSEIVIK